MIKRPTKKVTINFTPEEHSLLEKMATLDKREKATEVRWLVESYAKGELVTVGKLTELLAQYGRPIPVLRGASEELSVEVDPARARRQKE